MLLWTVAMGLIAPGAVLAAQCRGDVGCLPGGHLWRLFALGLQLLLSSSALCGLQTGEGRERFCGSLPILQRPP
jgi:hypothetical protein